MAGRRPSQFVQLLLHGLLHPPERYPRLVLAGSLRLSSVLVRDGRLVGADLLPPEELPDRRNRPTLRCLEEARERTVRLCKACRHFRVPEHVLLEEARRERPIGVDGREIEPSCIQLQLTFALVEPLDDVPRAQKSNQIESALLVPRRRGNDQRPSARPCHRGPALRQLVFRHRRGCHGESQVALPVADRLEVPVPVDLHRDLALDEGVEGPALKALLEGVRLLDSAKVVVDVRHEAQRSNDAGGVHRCVEAVGAQEAASSLEREHVEEAVTEARGEAEANDAAVRLAGDPIPAQPLGILAKLAPGRRQARLTVRVDQALLAEKVEIRVKHSRVADRRDAVYSGRCLGSGRTIARLLDRPGVVIAELEPIGVLRVLRFDVGRQVFERKPRRPLSDHGETVEEDDVRRNPTRDRGEEPLRVAGRVLGSARRRGDAVLGVQLLEAIDGAVDVVPQHPAGPQDDVLATVFARLSRRVVGPPRYRGDEEKHEERDRSLE